MMPHHPEYFRMSLLPARTLSCITTDQPSKSGSQYCSTATVYSSEPLWVMQIAPVMLFQPKNLVQNQVTVGWLSVLCPSVWNNFWVFVFHDSDTFEDRKAAMWQNVCRLGSVSISHDYSQATHLWQEGNQCQVTQDVSLSPDWQCSLWPLHKEEPAKSFCGKLIL